MLTVVIPEQEFWNERLGEFVYTKSYTIQLEHSLLSISKWESKWKKAFLSKREKTEEEALDYIRCMTISSGVPEEAYELLSPQNRKDIKAYIDDSMTATVIPSAPGGRAGPKRGDTMTSEVIYYMMTVHNIPFECQKWHINRLLTLIEVCNVKNASPNKKQSRADTAARHKAINAQNRARMHTKG